MSQSSGEPRTTRPPKDVLISTHLEHVNAQEKLRSGNTGAKPIKHLAPNDAYPASSKAIKDLEKVYLDELRTDTHHWGGFVVVQTISPPFFGAGVTSLVEDERGNLEKIAVYNHSEASMLSKLPEGCVVVVKEPYYKHIGKGDYMVSVDHPSDIVLLSVRDPMIPAPFKEGQEQVIAASTSEWRDAGDRAFIQRDLGSAVYCYTEALEAAVGDNASEKTGIHYKRAGTNLALGRFDAARDDALASISGKLTDWKAYLTAARAAYALQNYRASMHFLDSALELKSNDAGLKKERQRCEARLREETDGKYDFRAMAQAVTPQSVHLDYGTFNGPTEIRASPHHGRGLFATRDIEAGEVLFVEKALVLPNHYERAPSSVALYARMVQSLYNNPSLAERMLSLYSGPITPTGAEGRVVDGAPVVDVFQLEAIREKNCFSAPRSTYELARSRTSGAADGPVSAAAAAAAATAATTKGLWPRASTLNHSCVPNSVRSFLGDMIISRAARRIPAGAEVQQKYAPPRSVPAARARALSEAWGFACACALCAGEARSPAAAHGRRAALLAEAEALVRSRPPSRSVPPAAIRSVGRLVRRLEAAHEPGVYAALPRLTLVYPATWLLEAHRARRAHAKVVRFAMTLLRNLGFVAAEAEGGSVELLADAGGHAVLTIGVARALKYAADAHRALGEEAKAVKCEEAARLAFLMITGFEDDLDKLEMLELDF